MKKIIYLCILLITFFFFIPLNVFASFDAIISGDSVRIRSNPGTENTALYTVNAGTSITLDDKTLYDGTGCSQKWYKINYKEQVGYVCSKYVKFVNSAYDGMHVVDWEARVNANNVTVRKSSNTSSSSLGTLSLGVNVVILDTVSSNDSNCSSKKWYKINYYKNKTGYICSKYVTKKSSVTAYDEEYSNTLKAAGFTDSYIPYLTYLHNKYPAWTFIAKKTNTNFNSSVSAEEGKNYMQTKNNNYRTSSTPAEGSSWFKVNSSVIAFYMDPRNWLTEQRIFMFEKLDYTSDFDDKYPTLIKAIFGSGKLADDKYTIPMFNAGKKNKISPVHIASRIKQEVSPNGSASTSGGEFTFKGKKYSGYYNFFNIGAYEETIGGVKYGAVTRGLAYAAKLIKRSGEVWDNIETSIVEGSSFLANGYITKGQGTLYYQKFNVSPDAYFSRYTHQYMTNIQAPATEGNSTYSSYKSSNILSEPFIFEIPVYNNMPLYTSLPDSGDSNNYLSILGVEGYTLSPTFDKDVLTYEVFVPYDTTEVNIFATPISIKSTVTGNGTQKVNDEEANFTITVTPEVGTEKKYVITIKKDDKPIDSTTVVESGNNTTSIDTSSLNIKNNTIVKVKNGTTASAFQSQLSSTKAKNIVIKNPDGNVISGNNLVGTNFSVTLSNDVESKTFKISVKGDTSGDGIVTSLDLLQVLKHIKGDKRLTGSYLLSADTSGDDSVTSLDLLQVLKHIKGDKKL